MSSDLTQQLLNQAMGQSDSQSSDENELVAGILKKMREDDEGFREQMRSHQEQIRQQSARLLGVVTQPEQSEEMSELIQYLQKVPALVKPTLEYVKTKVTRIQEAVNNAINEQ